MIEIFVPEFCPENEHYFIHNASFTSPSPVVAQDCSLWAVLDSLDTITSHFSVVLTKSIGSTAELYRINIENYPSSTIPYIFERTSLNGKTLFFVPNDRFLLFDASSPCIPIPNNSWQSVKSQFNTLAAFYRLNIVPTLSQSVFSHQEHFEAHCQKFYEEYKLKPPLNYAMQTLYKTIFNCLSFFGFAFPTTLKQKISLDAALELSRRPNDETGTQRLYAFTEIRWIIENYHKKCFPEREIPSDVISPETYTLLTDAWEFVRISLARLKLLPANMPVNEALVAGVNKFQRENGIPVGVCDLFTLRQLWNAVTPSTCEITTLCMIAGLGTDNTKPLNYTETIKKVTTMYPDPSIDVLETAFNDVITQVRTHKEGPRWLLNETLSSIGANISRIDSTESRAVDLSELVGSLKKRIESATQENKESEETFDKASKVLDKVIEEQLVIVRKFDQVNKRIIDQVHGNQILVFLTIFFAVILSMKLLFGSGVKAAVKTVQIATQVIPTPVPTLAPTPVPTLAPTPTPNPIINATAT